MKRGERGNVAVIALIIVLALIVALAAIFVWRHQSHKTPATTTTDSSQTAEIQEAKKTVVPETDTNEKITVVSLTLQRVGDEKMLPSVTPDTFIDYMKTKLNDFTCDYDTFPNGGYNVTKISDRFVAGGIGCEGGAATVWYLTGLGWDELGYQSVVPCSSLVEKAIPSDFLAQCYDDANPDAVIDNPNGPLNPAN